MKAITATRPDGYFGDRVKVKLFLKDNYIIEERGNGCWHKCPAVSMAQDMAEVNWLLDHHPNFKNYRRV